MRRTIAESKKKHEEKQLKAQQLRDKLREEKSHKLQKLLERVSPGYVLSRCGRLILLEYDSVVTSWLSCFVMKWGDEAVTSNQSMCH